LTDATALTRCFAARRCPRSSGPTTRARQRSAEPWLRVVVVDDDARIRRGLRELIDASSDVRVVGQAASRSSALSLDLELRPDVAVVDVLLPHANDGCEVLHQLTERGRDTIAISVRPDLAPRALAAGARVFLAKGPQILSGLVQAIREGAPR
jgi:DNA-binding NarL/FixJ family response regulator